jgi:DNA-binding MarR family transcriptional regulator
VSRAATRSLREIVEVSREFEHHVGTQLSINATDLAAMEHLIASGPLGPTELARRLRITPPAATAVVDRLSALGHASRVSHPTDRRGVVITPAPDSVKQAMGILMPMISDVDSVLDAFDDEEQAVIAAYLERVVAAYRAHLPA